MSAVEITISGLRGPEGPGSAVLQPIADEAAVSAAAAASSAAVAELAASAALAAGRYYTTLAAGIAASAVNSLFFTDESGSYVWYRRTGTTPFAVTVQSPAGGNPFVIVARAGTAAAATASYICDGTADEVEINAAIAQLAGNGGGTVILATGTYATARPIVGANKVHIAGEPGARIHPAASWAGNVDATGVITYTAKSDFSVSGVEINSRINNTDGNGIELRPDAAFAGTPCSNYRIFDNVVRLKKNAHVYHIWSMRGQNAEIYRNLVDGGYTLSDTWNGSEEQEGIEVYGGVNVNVHDNRAMGIGNAAYNILCSTSDVGNTGVSQLRIVNNTVDICGRGILAYPTSSATNGVAGLEDCIIANNILKNVTVSGIQIEVPDLGVSNGAAVPLRNISVINNAIVMAPTRQIAGSRGILLNNQRPIGDVQSSNNTIDGNRISGHASTDPGATIQITRLRNFSASYNRLTRTALAASNHIACLLILCEDFTFDDNVIDGARLYGINAQGCKSGSISRNQLRNWNAYLGGVSAIRIEGFGAAVPANLQVLANRLFTATPDNIGSLIFFVNESSNCTIADNYYMGASSLPIVFYAGANAMNTAGYFQAAPFVLPYAATVTPNFGWYQNFELLLTGNATLANPTNITQGQSGTIRVIQDATGSRTLAYGTLWRFAGGQAVGGVLSTAATAIDLIHYQVGSDGRIYATLERDLKA